MNCCANCFRDPEILEIIKSSKHTGHCDLCDAESIPVYDCQQDNILADMFEPLLEIYKPISSLPDDFPKTMTSGIADALNSTWEIFNLDNEKALRFLASILPEKLKSSPELFSEPVGVPQLQDKDYLKEKSILGFNDWNDFAESIKTKNRFHSNHINWDIFYLFLDYIWVPHKKGDRFYRARICKNGVGYEAEDMGAPPSKKASPGRANAEGISCLYLANSEETAVREVRSALFDDVTVATFELTRDIKIVDLEGIDKISPFSELDPTQYVVNKKHLEAIRASMIRPIRQNDNRLDYIPTQCIVDYIKTYSYDGIGYGSAMHKDGYNLAIFNEDSMRCISTKNYRISSLEYVCCPPIE